MRPIRHMIIQFDPSEIIVMHSPFIWRTAVSANSICSDPAPSIVKLLTDESVFLMLNFAELATAVGRFTNMEVEVQSQRRIFSPNIDVSLCVGEEAFTMFHGLTQAETPPTIDTTLPSSCPSVDSCFGGVSILDYAS